MNRNGILILVLFLTALAPGCSQPGKDWPDADVTEQEQNLSILDQTDHEATAPQQVAKKEEPSQTPSAGDSATEPQVNNGRQSPDTTGQTPTTSTTDKDTAGKTEGSQPAVGSGELDQTILTGGGSIDGPIENELVSPDIATQSDQMPITDPSVDATRADEQPPTDTVELNQSKSEGPQSAAAQEGNGQPGVFNVQGNALASLATQQTINPLWVTGPSPHDIESNERSYLIGGAIATESAEVIPASGASSPFQEYSATQLLGTLQLLKIIRRFRTTVAYKGGANLSEHSSNPFVGKQIEAMTASESISWPRAQVNFVDTFRDYPGVPYSSGLGGSEISDFIGSNVNGTGPIRHLSDVALGSATYDLTPRSGVTVLGSYSLTHYFGLSSLNNDGTSVLAGYTYQFTPRTSVSASYGYDYWKFSGGQSDAAQVGQFAYQHQVSPRITVTVGAGPQFITSRNITELQLGLVQIPIVLPSHQTTFNANAWFSYSIPKGTLGFLYEHSLTSGAGLFAGANTDSVSVTLMRSIFRNWTTSFAAGITRLSSVENEASGSVGSTFQYGFASVSLQRRIGPHVNLAASYEFNEESTFSGCSASSGCGTIVHTALFTLTWHTLPIFLDRGNVRQQTAPFENPLVNAQDLLQTH